MFDACRGIKTGELYEFTFTKAGVWNFHDHLYASFSGKITVAAVPGYVDPTALEHDVRAADLSVTELVKALIDKLKIKVRSIYYEFMPKKLDAWFVTLDMFEVTKDKGVMKEVLHIAGAERTMNELLVDAEEGATQRDCHQQAHQLGHSAFEMFGATVFEKGDFSCHSGFYHGAMEAFITESGTENLSERIDTLCANFDTSFGEFECLHGVGHGVMAYESYSLPAALDACASLKDEYSQRSCYGGAFMENIVTGQGLGAVPGHQTKWLSDDPHFPCNAVSKEYLVQYECYQMQTSRMLTISGYNFDTVRDECLQAPENMKNVCFVSLGRDIAGVTLRDPQKMKTMCGALPITSPYYQKCIKGALNVVVDFWGPKLGTQAQEFCDILDPHTRKTCEATLQMRMLDFSKKS